MPEIREIQIRSLDIPSVPDWLMNYPQSIPPVVPVTQNIGTPIVNIPGCVEAHEANNGSKTLQSDDPNGTLTFCDGNIPSFNPINFEPNQLLPTQKPEVDTRQPKPPSAPDYRYLKLPLLLLRWTAPHQHKQQKNLSAHTLRGLERRLLTIS
jgi:hypothetical protein